MARPIKATPVLRGEDARKFIAAANNPQPFYPPTVNNEKAIEEIKKRLLSREQKQL